ncbi:hypothetical protein [Streptomyces clavuligerus]|uniref:hypothetical protein n=1 Tax=Streptomyces clavuligerus TaxID=1901 RepID=UPI00020D9195|nr:hypothetical protein [Streptomyces clavuligerus]WDN55890.1 hypothetical protein LL058_28750 [Streptomyces clavuligerus]
MYQDPMVFRFTASGSSAERAFARQVTEDRKLPADPFARRADLAQIVRVAVVRDRSALDAATAGYFNDTPAPALVGNGSPLSEDDAEWMADRLMEDGAPCVRPGSAGALLLAAAGPEPTWLFFGWSPPVD